MQMKGASGHSRKRGLRRTVGSDVEGLVRVQQQTHARMEEAILKESMRIQQQAHASIEEAFRKESTRIQQQISAMEQADRSYREVFEEKIQRQQEMINLAIANSIGHVAGGRGVGAPDTIMPSPASSEADTLSRLWARLDQLVAPHVQEDVHAMRQLREHGRELGDRIDALASGAAALTEELERALER